MVSECIRQLLLHTKAAQYFYDMLKVGDIEQVKPKSPLKYRQFFSRKPHSLEIRHENKIQSEKMIHDPKNVFGAFSTAIGATPVKLQGGLGRDQLWADCFLNKSRTLQVAQEQHHHLQLIVPCSLVYTERFSVELLL